ncbi:MAG: hypothetical protein JEZ09_00325 [Salinivirgaceae bacterium]|nr:hypothetical protein [Salinivirgaceae bacterium]
MIKQLIKITTFVIVISLPLLGFSQTNDYTVRKCFGYQKDSCKISRNIFYKVHNESRSALFLKGQTSQTPITIYNGRDYRISLCWDHVLGNQIQFRLLDRETNDLLYDNATDEFSSDFEFTVTQTREIIIEISIPGSSSLVEAMGNDELIIVRKDTDMGCLGVLIEHMITPTKGF